MSLHAAALDPQRSLRQLYHTAWSVKDGAPGQVTALAQSRDGYLWLGTQTGLFRFDGVVFERVAAPGSSPFPATSVSALYAPPDGGLWIGFRYGAASFLRDGRVTHFGEDDGLPTGSVVGFATTPDGLVWAATFQGLAQLHGARWERVDASWNFPGQQARALFVDGRGTLWAASDDTLAFLPAGARRFQIAERAVRRISQIAQAREGRIWVAESDGVVRPVAVPGRPASTANVPFPSAGLLFDRDGSLWATSLGDGLRRVPAPAQWRDDTLQLYRQNDTLSSDYLGPVIEDREGNVWLGSSRGLDRFRETTLLPAEFPDGAYDFALAAGDDGAVFAGSKNRALMRLRDRHVAFLDLPPEITAAHRDGNGTVWLGGPGGLWRMQDETPMLEASLPPQVGHSGVQAIARDGAGALWASLNTPGVFRWAAGQWTHIDDSAPLPDGSSPLSILADAETDAVWLGFARNEIAVLRGDTRRMFGLADGLDVGNVTALHRGRRALWIGGERGLAWFDGDRVHTFDTFPDTPFVGISGIVESEAGDLWLNGAAGIVRVAAADIERAIARGTLAAVPHDVFGFLDGLPGTPAQFRPLPSAVAGTDGRLWFATTSGVVSVEPARIVRNRVPPPVDIRAIHADANTFAPVHGIDLGQRVGSVQIDYTALSLAIPERVRFRYRLDGFDDDWQDVGTRREAFYTGLAPGTYSFHVIAANNDGVWNNDGARLEFRIAPAFIQTEWFVGLCIAAALLLLYVAYVLRLRHVAARIRSRLHERHLERERIARELHDTLLQSVQGLILRFQAVAETIPAEQPARAAMETALERADGVMLEGRDRVLDLRAASSDSDLSAAFADVARELADEHPIDAHPVDARAAAAFRAVDTGTPRPLDPIVRDELFRIGREALINAYRHADASAVHVETTHAHDELRLRITDDGRGIDAAVLDRGGKPGHWGLYGMRERAERIGARLVLRSRSGAGTEIELRIPAAAAYLPCPKDTRRRWLHRLFEGNR